MHLFTKILLILSNHSLAIWNHISLLKVHVLLYLLWIHLLIHKSHRLLWKPILAIPIILLIFYNWLHLLVLILIKNILPIEYFKTVISYWYWEWITSFYSFSSFNSLKTNFSINGSLYTHYHHEIFLLYLCYLLPKYKPKLFKITIYLSCILFIKIVYKSKFRFNNLFLYSLLWIFNINTRNLSVNRKSLKKVWIFQNWGIFF